MMMMIIIIIIIMPITGYCESRTHLLFQVVIFNRALQLQRLLS